MKPGLRLPFWVPALIGPGAVLFGLTKILPVEANWLFVVLGTMATLATLLVTWTIYGVFVEPSGRNSPPKRLSSSLWTSRHTTGRGG